MDFNTTMDRKKPLSYLKNYVANIINMDHLYKKFYAIITKRTDKTINLMVTIIFCKHIQIYTGKFLHERFRNSQINKYKLMLC